MISPPEIKAAGGTYQLTFQEPGLRIHVDRIVESSRGETSGEFRITGFGSLIQGHLHHARLNMLSSRSKIGLARDLASDVLGEESWRQIIEYVSVMVVDAHREGAPVIHMSEYGGPSEGLKFRISPYLQERQATVIFGDGDTGKSFLAILMGYLVASGRHALGMEAEPGGVLYLDYETDEDTVWDRIDWLSVGFAETLPEHFYYRRMHQTVAADFSALSRIMLQHKISLVVVDSAAPAVGEPEASGPTSEYFRALRGLDATTLTIAHVSKTGEQTHPFGSIFWRNLPRANFRVISEQDEARGMLRMGVRHTKANNGRRMADRAYDWLFDSQERKVTIKNAETANIEAMETGMSYARRISLILADGKASVRDLAESLNTTEGTVRMTLNRELRKGAVIKIGNDWGLSAQHVTQRDT